VQQPSPLYKRHRFPGEVLSHAVWLYYRFLLSYRDVEELLVERGIEVSYETVRRWCRKFGQTFADGLRRRRARPGDKWHIDEVQLKINGAGTGCGGPWTKTGLLLTRFVAWREVTGVAPASRPTVC
jgi:putative transposase